MGFGYRKVGWWFSMGIKLEKVFAFFDFLGLFGGWFRRDFIGIICIVFLNV